MNRIIAVFLVLLSTAGYAQDQSEQIINMLAPSLYQIRLIDKASGEKSSIGSGFQISGDGMIATNYHVIANYAQHPTKYQIEYLDHLGKRGLLDLKSVDVINDLALVKREPVGDMSYFSIAEAPPERGEEIYSLGNPHDLGMIVVPGIYNGLKKQSFNDRIHFTGAINPGMSGGPVVNYNTEIVGINVATSGNQIGFLIPHDKLAALYKAYQISPPEDINQQISTQLSQNQEKLFSTLLTSDWQIKELGRGLIPTIDVPFVRCWGDSNADSADALMLSVATTCTLDEYTYLTSNFITDTLSMEFRFLQAKDLINTKFYYLYEQQIQHAGPSNAATKDDVSEYECQHDIVMAPNHGINNKTILCTRVYKKYPQLFDVLYLSASVDRDDQALISHFTLSGVEKDNALAFTRKFMESVSWR